jgi:hypothetical protein
VQAIVLRLGEIMKRLEGMVDKVRDDFLLAPAD